MILGSAFPQPADALLEVGELVGAEPCRAFIQEGAFAGRAVPVQVGDLRERFVVGFPVGTAGVPLGFAGDGQAAIAGDPVVEDQLRPSAHGDVDLMVADDFRYRLRVGPEVVAVGSAASGVGVVVERIHHVVSGEFAVAEVEIDPFAQLEIPCPTVFAHTPVGCQLRFQRARVAVCVDEELMGRSVLAGGASGHVAVHDALAGLLREQENQVLGFEFALAGGHLYRGLRLGHRRGADERRARWG